MNHFDYFIIGGGNAGVSAAETIRQEDPRGTVGILSDELHPLYSRVLLPHFAKGLIAREQIFLRTVHDYEKAGIVFLSARTAERLDVGRRRIILNDGTDVEFGKLLLAGGGTPRRLGLAGEDILGVSRFQTLEDVQKMRESVALASAAVVVGGGFIALEYLEVLEKFGIPAILLLSRDRIFSGQLDRPGSELLHENFRRHGVQEIITGDRLERIVGSNRLNRIRTERGRVVECDFLGVGIGLEKNVQWLASSGIEYTPVGVRTDAFLETAVTGIFAAGDIADFDDIVLGGHHARGNWSNASLQGRIAGWNMTHPDGMRSLEHVSGYSIRNLGMIISFLGRSREGPGIESVIRGSLPAGIYERFFLEDSRLVGAVIINRPEDYSVLTALILRQKPIADARRRLADPFFDISHIEP